ncbi:MAG: exopolyphosphatase [Chitinophagaceae bacterium]|nr:exopolyphosphatase [Chitinophagaceae bacterium]
MIIGAIDIGSNAVRLLITEAKPYQNGQVDYTKLQLLRIPLRLGFDVFANGVISLEKEKELIDTMKAFQLVMGIYKVAHFRACATSAMRDALNGPQIIKDVLAKTGIHIEIINGQEEANIIYETHIAENMSAEKAYLYIDVGGGSTEITLFSKGKIICKESFNIGTIRLLNNDINEAHWASLKSFVKLHAAKQQPLVAIGSGGNINKIFSLSKKKEGKPLSLDLLKDYYRELSASTVEERMHRYNFRTDRADVIVPALQIFIAIMRWSGAMDIYVPKIGLADGLIKIQYTQQMKAL